MAITRSVEYDAFGPWILAVTDPDEVPRAFRDYPFDFGTADFVLKLPRDIARRDATPDMHLYDSMVIVDSTGLTLLTRVGDGFETSSIAARTIGAIEQSAELLDGLLTVHGTDGTRVDVPYNSASSTVISAAVHRLLELAGARGEGTHASDPMDITALGVGDIGLVNTYLDVSLAIPGLRVRTAYGTSPAVSTEALLNRVRKGRAQLSGAVICGNESQLIVVSRRAWLARRHGKPDLSTKRTVILRARVTGAQTSARPLVEDVTTVTVNLGAARLDFAVPANGDAARALTQR